MSTEAMTLISRTGTPFQVDLTGSNYNEVVLAPSGQGMSVFTSFLATGAGHMPGAISIVDTGQSLAGMLEAIRDALPPKRRGEVFQMRFGKSKDWRRHIRRSKAAKPARG